MIDWGAEGVIGGHPHGVEPAETLTEDGDKKFIIYTMGNFWSNQRNEAMDGVENAKWIERGLLMDVTFRKKGKKTTNQTVKAHPTRVRAWSKGTNGREGYELYNYRIFSLGDFNEGGKYRDE